LFGDPLVLYTVAPTGATNAVAFTGAGSSSVSFIRTGAGPTSSTYRYTVSATDYYDLFVGRQSGKRNRYTFRLTHTTLVPTITDTSINEIRTSTVYVVVDIPLIGLAALADNDLMYHMLSYLLYDSTDNTPVMRRVVAGET
jgi:hypothetical protein